MPRGSGVVVDYSIPREMMTENERRAFDALAERVARAGEPFRLFFDPAQLEMELRALGFREVEDQTGAEVRALRLNEEASRQGRPGRPLCARV